MTADEAETVKAIMAAMSDAVQSAWRHQEAATVGHMNAALALHRTISRSRTLDATRPEA